MNIEDKIQKFLLEKRVKPFGIFTKNDEGRYMFVDSTGKAWTDDKDKAIRFASMGPASKFIISMDLPTPPGGSLPKIARIDKL